MNNIKSIHLVNSVNKEKIYVSLFFIFTLIAGTISFNNILASTTEESNVSYNSYAFDPNGLTKTNMCGAVQMENEIIPVKSGVWTQNSTWPNGKRPTLSDNVVIPEGITVTLFGNCFAKSITVNGTLNAFKGTERGSWINLTTEYIMVMGENSLFEIGTEEKPYTSTQGCTITLLGEPGTLIPGTSITSKAIMVMNNATMVLYGEQKKSWTQLGTTAEAGSNRITLKEDVNWEEGDEIVIASTDFDMNHAEARTILSRESATNYILDSALVYKHFGEVQSYTHKNDASISWELDERAEVGLLSRNIKIQGDDTSEENSYGGHIMCMSESKMRAANIELYRMGQKAILGRYPWHWHLLQDGGDGLYLKSSSVHRTYNRAVTIHGTNKTEITENVAYDNLGHAYFFEDGNEVDNVMQYNLGLVTRRPAEEDALLPSDIDFTRNMSGPATFWITNPLNKINFNHAAGSDGSGIWFAPHQNANSALHDPNLIPNHIPVPDGNWDNNVAHSCSHGVLVGPTLFKDDKTQSPNPNVDYYVANAPSQEVIEIENYTLYKNLIGAYLRVGQSRRTTTWRNFVIADNYKGDALTWDGDMYNFLWVGASENYEPFPAGPSIGGAAGLVHLHTIYDGPCRVHDSHFAGVLPEMSLFDQWGANAKYVGHTMTNTTVEENSFHINWRNINNRPVWETATVVDTDGKFTGRDPMTVMHKYVPMLSNENTSPAGETNNAISSPANKYCYVEVTPSDESFTQKRQKSRIIRSDNVVQEDNAVEIRGVGLVPMVNAQYTYELIYENEIPAFNKVNFFSMDAGDFVIIGFPEMPTTTFVSLQERLTVSDELSDSPPVNLLNSLDELKTTTGNAYAFEGDVLYIRYQAHENARFDQRSNQGVMSLCLNSDCSRGPGLPYKDSDGDGVYNLNEREIACRDVNNARDLNFNFNKSFEGFEFVNTAVQAFLGANLLVRTDFQEESYIERTGLSFQGNQVRQLEIRAFSEIAGDFQFEWTNQKDGLESFKSITIPYETARTFKDILLDLENVEGWKDEIIETIRFKFPEDSSAKFHSRIGYIRTPETKIDQFIGVEGVHGLMNKTEVEVCDGGSVIFDFRGNFSNEWNFTYIRPDSTEFQGGLNNSDNDQLRLENLVDNSPEEGVWIVNYTNPAGCAKTAEFTLNVDKEGEACIVTSVYSDKQATDVNIYPNPASDHLIIENEELTSGSTISLLQLDGKLIDSKKVDRSGKFVFDLNAIESGLYFISIQNDSGQTIKKVKIER